MDSSGNVANINVFAPDGLVGRKEGSTWTYYTFDQQGNVAQRLDASQAVQTSRVFDAWGEGAETTLPRSVDCWNYNAQWGYYNDRETGLYYCQNRMYDATTGRWINRDPIGYAGGVNLYGYCGGGPVGNADPTGLALETVIDVVGLALDVYGLVTEPSWANAGYAGWSAAGMLVPFLPGSWVRRIPKLAGKTDDAVRGVARADSCDPILLPDWDGPPISEMPKKRGSAPRGMDGFPLEGHHAEQEDGKVVVMSRTDHRLGDNYKKNHSNTGQEKSRVDRGEWNRQRRKLWSDFWDTYVEPFRGPGVMP